MNFYIYFILFLTYSFIGWVIEIFDIYFLTKKWINRGFLIGPYCPIYGFGGILMTLLLNKYVNDPLVLFIMAMVICSILEYSTSFIMEKIFKARWWDYSNNKFNINGRICLETMIPFGLLGCFLIYILNPFLKSVLTNIPSNILNIVSIILLVLFILDNIISYSIITKIHISTTKELKDSTEEITKKVREYISEHSRFGKRLMKSFPKYKSMRKK